MTATEATTALDGTPTRLEGPGGAFISDPVAGEIIMGGSEWDGAPQIPGTKLVLHAMGDRTDGALTFAEVTFPVGQRPWFHAHHGEDEGFYVLEGQLTVTIIDEEGKRHKMVTNPGELVWGPKDFAHSYHITSDVPCRTIIVLTPGSTLPTYFRDNQFLELDPTDAEAVEAFRQKSLRLYDLEFFPNIPLDD
jgi:quercetin dioxygenase-like cupin family protein